MIQQLRQGIFDRSSAVVLEDEVERNEVYVAAGHKGNQEACQERTTQPTPSPEGREWVGTPVKEMLSIFGMTQESGSVLIRMLQNVKQETIGLLIQQMIAKGSVVFTNDYDISSRLSIRGYDHRTVCHAKGGYADDDDGDGFCETPVNPLEGF